VPPRGSPEKKRAYFALACFDGLAMLALAHLELLGRGKKKKPRSLRERKKNPLED